MRLALRLLIVLLLAASTVPLPAAPAPAQVPAAKTYVCPMAEHPKEYDHPGQCPLCGMDLVEQSQRLRVAVLVFDHAEDIDFTAPIEVFGQSGAKIFTVAATTDSVTTVFGLHLRPDYDLAHAPAADLLLIPGGGVDAVWKDERVLAWIRLRAAQSRYVMSVCNGAFILAKAGLLDGLSATTTAPLIEPLAAFAPKTRVVRERLVDNGKIITTGGLSAGIDGALHVLDREYGRTRAEEIARNVEYRWQPDQPWTRAALADVRLPDISLPSTARWERQASAGDTEHWTMSGRLELAGTADALLDEATRQITANGWTLRDTAAGRRVYAKADMDGRTWVTTLSLVPDGAAAFKESMSVRDAGKDGR
jgi:putative intracellular protease/amidase